MFTESQTWNRPQHYVIFITLLIVSQLPLLIALFTGSFELASALISVLSSLIICTLWFSIKLLSKIDQEGISLKFKPFHRKHRMYLWCDIEKVHVKEYSPLFEYGGWGIKQTSFGKNSDIAFNISGNKGIQIKFKNGKTVMLGTQKSDEAKLIIEKFMPIEK